jgi:3-hydroxyacyl-[acyl-carrier-protein] dehydratase
MNATEIIARLPYQKPFLFVDELLHVDKNGAKGTFTFDENLEFYKGHFKTKAVTPGVILIETMAQIGVVCLGIYLLHDTFNSNSVIALTSAQVEFLKPVYPNTKVIVKSEKIYFRFGKLKCKVVLENEKGEALCNGTIAGMISQ